MQIDIVLDSQLPSAQLRELGLLAERHGIHAVWCASYLDGRDPFGNLTELARASSTIRLGPIALSPYELHPFRIAMALLTLNELCPGRAQAIIGGGGEVVMALEIPRTRRVRAVREAIDIVKGATTRRPFSYHGQMYSINDYDPQWITAAAPPAVFAAANRPQMLRMSARAADGIMMSDLSPALARAAVGAVHGHLREFGRDPAAFGFNNFMAWYVYDDLQEARHEARRWIGFRAIFREYMMREFMSADDFAVILEHIPQIYAMAARNAHSVEGLPDRLLDMCVDHLTLTGTTGDMDHVIAHLLELKAAGCTQVSLELKKHQAHGIRLIGERVIPALR
ncbi:MAG: LLM class flavin-dependent oxidoreductase [Gammaproteobacteria bacterium]|nr:LLM class flavin-dependent oxidoreductase [Gammaproteobacteria bacterium]